MSDRLEITFAALNAEPEPTTVVLAGDGLELGPKARELDTQIGRRNSERPPPPPTSRASYKSTIEILAPAKIGIDRLIVAGIGKTATLTELQLVELGGAILARFRPARATSASVIIDVDGTDDMKAEEIAATIAQGAMLRHYNFKKYHTKKTATKPPPKRTA